MYLTLMGNTAANKDVEVADLKEATDWFKVWGFFCKTALKAQSAFFSGKKHHFKKHTLDSSTGSPQTAGGGRVDALKPAMLLNASQADARNV